MMKPNIANYRLTSVIFIIILLSCRADKTAKGYNAHQSTGTENGINKSFPESFEEGNKAAYAAGEVSLRTGTWLLQNCLIGKSDKDHGNGKASIRMEAGGRLTMMFDIRNKVRQVGVVHSLYGDDASGRWSLWISKDYGAHWMQSGSEIASGASIAKANFTLDIEGPIRFEIRASSGGRINIDDIDVQITGGSPASGDKSSASSLAMRDDNMALGNPSGATLQDRDNYLLAHQQYTLSYNNSKGIANWVSWQLSTAWRGAAKRCNCFASDGALPSGFRKASPSDYTGSGFGRGHLCPSDDRKTTAADNAATFLMTNVSPQAQPLNQQPWEHLEAYCRKLASRGNELYIIAGGYGSGGESSNGGIVKSIGSDAIEVPSHFWKIIVVLPIGSNDVERINQSTRIIAVDMPNVQSVSSHDWNYYRTTVDAVERATGYDFLSNVATPIQEVVESKMDNGPDR